jgi:hypothetical protein
MNQQDRARLDRLPKRLARAGAVPTAAFQLAGDRAISPNQPADKRSSKNWCRPLKLYSHLCRTNCFPREYDTAFRLFPAEPVVQNESLIGRFFGYQADQRSMRADRWDR